MKSIAGVANVFNASSTFDSTKLHQRPGIQPAFVTMDTDMDTLRNRYTERCRKRVADGFNFIQQSQFVEANFKRIYTHSTVSTLLFNKIERILKQMLKLFARALI